MIIVTAAGRQIDISRQIDDLIGQSRHQDTPESISSIRTLGRRIGVAAGTATLVEVLHVLSDQLAPDYLAMLTAIWNAVAEDLEAAGDEDKSPSNTNLIMVFERTHGAGAWAQCEAAARAALRTHRNMTMDRVTVEHLRRHGIGQAAADEFLTLTVDRPKPGRPRAGTVKRRATG
jgi:hypothetical protein